MDRLWTDMHCILEPDKAINIKLYPAYIPEGEIFKTMVYVSKTQDGFFKVYIWKDKKSVFISSDYNTQEFAYSGPEHQVLKVTYLPPLPLLVSTTGKSADYVGQHQGYPVYRTGGCGGSIMVLEDK